MPDKQDNCSVRSYLRRPDPAFWLDLFTPLPPAAATDHIRRARFTRYALGASVLITTFYFFLSMMVSLSDGLPIVLVNVVSLACYGMGVWAASLHAERIARLWLMVTVNAQMAALIWLTGPVLGVSIFCLVTAVLARVIFEPHEQLARLAFIGFPLLSLVFGLTLADHSFIDFSSVSSYLLSAIRVANTVFAMLFTLVIIGIFDREVLKTEVSLVRERERSDRLLHAVLPQKIANQLRENDRMIADRHPEVTVLFADIAGFTPWASQQEPEVVVALLEKVFSRFDARLSHLGAEKIKTIGDAYMVVSGAPDPRADHAHVIANLALALLEEIKLVRAETGIALDMRIGIHTGSVIAGVIGAVRFTYDIWGDTVNTASRMESHGEAGRIQISQETKERIEDAFVVEHRGMIDVKGKGDMETWWLLAPI
jgi:class 3 adenylate cyclase